MPRHAANRTEAVPAADFSLTVSRALRILAMFSHERPEFSLTEVCRETQLSKASVFRFMQALVLHGFADQDPVTKRYRPGFEAFRVGSLFLSQSRLQMRALPRLRALTAETGFTSYLATLHGDQMMVLASVEGPGPLRFSIPVGNSLAMHSTATGQAALAKLADAEIAELLERTGLPRRTEATITALPPMLARIKQIRSQNFAVSWEQSSLGVASVAAPVTNAAGGLLAVLALGFATGQVEKSECSRLGARIRQAAEELSAELTGAPDRVVA